MLTVKMRILESNINILDILSISRGINFRDSAGQFFLQGFSFAKMAKKRENAKVSPPKVEIPKCSETSSTIPVPSLS